MEGMVSIVMLSIQSRETLHYNISSDMRQLITIYVLVICTDETAEVYKHPDSHTRYYYQMPCVRVAVDIDHTFSSH